MTGRTPRRSWFVVTLALLLALQTANRAWASGRLGHGVTSRIAEKYLNPKVKEAVKALLDEGESLADASTWPDEVRGRMRHTAPSHYVDVPLAEPKYDRKWSADDPKHGCVVDKINEFRLVVKDTTKTVEERRFALRFLIHCIENLHMPPHVGDNHDRGGNDTQVRFFDRGTNMHRLWDSDMIEWNTRSEDVWLADVAELDSPEARATAMKATVEEWATESLKAAKSAYQVPEAGKRITSGEKLAKAYFDANLPVARQRLYQGGIRLAMVLNEAFPAD